MFFLPVSRSEGEKMNWLWQKKKWEKKPTFEMYTFKEKKQKTTIYSLPIAHSLCQHVKILSVCVALKKKLTHPVLYWDVFRRAHC